MSTFHSFLHPPIYRRLCTITPKTQQIPINHNKYYHIMLSALKDDDTPSNPLPPLSQQRDTATSPSCAAAIISGIGSAVAGVIGLPPPLPPPPGRHHCRHHHRCLRRRCRLRWRLIRGVESSDSIFGSSGSALKL
jgi:hypothetical protein